MNLIKIFVVVVSVLFTACATTPTVRFMRYSDIQYPPTSNVQVLQIKPPDRAFRELGVLSIRLKRDTQDDAILYLVNRAKEIGADAIVVLGEVSAGAVAIPMGNMAVAVPLRDLQALAIRYESR